MVTRIPHALGCAAVLLLLGACVRTSAPATDDELIQAVRDAATANVSLQDAEKQVGVAAVINTSRPGDRDRLAYARVILDPAQQSEIKTLRVNDVVYWKRLGTFDRFNVVGLAWDTGQPPKVFFAVVYPSNGVGALQSGQPIP